MIIFSARALLIFLSLIVLVCSGELPWWVLMLVVFYQVDYQFKFWLPGKKKQFQTKIEELLKQKEEQVFAALPKNLKPEDIN